MFYYNSARKKDTCRKIVLNPGQEVVEVEVEAPCLATM